MTRTLLALGAIALLGTVSGAAAAPPTPSGTWAGTFSVLNRGDPVDISVELRGSRAAVTLASGHPVASLVAARRMPGRLRFSLPGRPPLVFDGRLSGGGVAGTVRQGARRGSFRLSRGTALEARSLGLYALPGDRFLSVAEPLDQRLAVELDEGGVHGLYRTGKGAYDVGAGIQVRRAIARAAFTRDGVVYRGERGSRVAVRQEEVLVRSGNALLSCTLTLPAGPGRHPAAAFAHGSGPALRSWVSTQARFLERLGIATLACDKRGIGQSGGTYPGESASEQNIEQYARDVEAQARFLATQPEVDRARVGLFGASQAGWIMPLAASREPAVRWLVLLVSPTVTQGESDYYSDLTGQGASVPQLSLDQIEAEVRKLGPSGFDPLPSLRRLGIPAIWAFGANDQHVPTRMSVERLEALTRESGRDLSYVVFPSANHSLLVTEHGLNEEAARADRFAPGLYTTLRDWLRERRIAS